MDAYKTKAIFHLPGVFVFSKFYEEFLEFYETHKGMFKDNIEIGSIYGCPYPAIWNGGRYMENPAPIPIVKIIQEFMEKHQIPIRLTYTNVALQESHLNDTYCNLLTSQLHNSKHEILCNSPILEDYLRKNYPDFKFISSTTKRLLDIDKLNEELEKDYKLVVLDYTKNKDFDFLAKIKHPEKIEILCNAVCQPNCQMRSQHYEIISKAILNFDPTQLITCDFCNLPFGKAKLHPHFISDVDIDRLLDLGIRNFKLEGRTTHLLDLIEILVYYLIKQEYQDRVRQYLQSIFYK